MVLLGCTPLPASLVHDHFSNRPGHFSPASQWVTFLNPQRALGTPSQGNVDDAEGCQVGIRDAQSKGRFGTLLARPRRTVLHNCLLHGVA